MKKLLLATILSICFVNLRAQLSGTVSVPGTYTSLAACLNDLNTQGINGGFTVYVASNYTETVPVGGYSLYATGTVANPLVFQKSGTGANPLLLAYPGGTASPTSAVQDGMWRLIGCDYVTIDGIDLLDNNTSNFATMEFGYGLFKSNITNGCRFNTIRNCTITLNRINCANGTTPASEGSRGIDMVNATTAAHTSPLVPTTALGSNSNNIFERNFIQNCNIGIALIGYVSASPFTFTDQNNTVGGLLAANGNTIINFGGGVDNTNPSSAGIKTQAQYSLTVASNLINNNDGSGVDHIFRMYGILSLPAQSAQQSILNNTISVRNSSGTFTLTGIENQAGSTAASNTIDISGNLFLNCVHSATATTSHCFLLYNNGATPAGLNITGNTFSNTVSSAANGLSYLIYNTGAASTVNISGNSAASSSLTGNASSGSFGLAYNGNIASGGLVNIASNTLQAVVMPSGNQRIIYGVFNAGNPGSAGRINFTGNVLSNLSLNAPNNAYFMYNSSTSNNNVLVSNNYIDGSVTKTLGGGNFHGYYHLGSSSVNNLTITSNNFSNVNVGGTASFFGICLNSGNSSLSSIIGNTISAITAGTGTICGIYADGMGTNTLQANSLNTFSGSANVYGVWLSSCSGPSHVLDNTIHSFSTTGGSTVTAYTQISGTTNTYRNKIYNLVGLHSASEIFGLSVNTGSSNIYNNLIGDLRAPVAYNWNAITGINLAGSGPHLVSFNTVRLNASSTGLDFGTSALYASTSCTLQLRNNILINNSTANGSAFTVAYRRSTIGLSTYGSLSNNNLFYAGTPSASNLLFSDATNGVQTLAAYKAFVAPLDATSVTENTSFLSTTGSSANFLHLNPNIVSLAESGATNISGITSDYDLDIRQGNPGYTGGGIAPDIGADEYNTIYPNCTAANALTLTPTSFTICAGQAISFTRTATPDVPGIQQNWQVSSSNGGPYTTVSSATNTAFSATLSTPGTFYYVAASTCSFTSQTLISNQVTVVVSPYPVLSATPSSTTLCGNTASVGVSVSGAQAYTWSPSSGLSSANSSTALAYPAFTTTYVVTGSNPGNCTATTSIVITKVGAPGTLSVSATPSSICQGNLVSFSAAATTTNYQYTSIPFSPIPTPTSGVGTLCSGGSPVTPLSSGSLDDGNWYILPIPFNFNFYGLNYNGFSISTNGFLTLGNVVPNTNANYGVPLPNFSAGRPGIGAVYSDLDFGTAGIINTFISGVTPNRKVVVNWTNGRYYNGSSGTGSVTTQVILYETSNWIEVHTTRATGYNVAVEGIQDGNAVAASVVAGRNAQTFNITNDAYRWSTSVSYNWQAPTVLSSYTNASTSAANVQSSGAFTVTANLGNNCFLSAIANVSVNPSPTLSISGGTAAVCQGVPVTLTVSGATSYSWSNNSTATTATYAPLQNTTVTVTGFTTGNSCPGSAVRTITVNPNPTLTVSGPVDLCPGGTTTLSVTGADTYSWSNGNTTNTTVISPASTTVISVVGTNTLGNCITTTNASVTIYPFPTLSISGSNTVCSGNSVTLTAGGATSYSWSNGSTGSINIVQPSGNSTYTLTGSSSPANCSNTAVFSITTAPSPTLVTSPSPSICAGKTATLFASGASNYLWNSSIGGPLIVVAPPQTTNYTVTGTGSNGCTTDAFVTVYVTPPPFVVISGTNTSCAGDLINLTASGSSTYSWSTGSQQPGISVSPTSNTTYSVVGYSAIGCSNTAFINITVYPIPTVTFVADPSFSTCPGELVSITAQSGSAVLFNWGDGSTGNMINVVPFSNTVYNLNIKNNSTGCSSDTAVTITVIDCTSIYELAGRADIRISPNPTDGKLTVNLPAQLSGEIIITDLSGRIVYRADAMEGDNLLDLGGAARGVYLLQLTDRPGRNWKLVKE